MVQTGTEKQAHCHLNGLVDETKTHSSLSVQEGALTYHYENSRREKWIELKENLRRATGTGERGEWMKHG